MPNVRTVVLKPEVPSKWSQETSLKLVLLALGPASPKIESLDPSDFPVGPDNSSTASHNWHRRWYRIDDISRELVEFCWHGKHLGDAFPKLRKLKIAKNVRRSSNGPSADPDRQAKSRIPARPHLRTAAVSFEHRWSRSPAYSQDALMTLAKAAPNFRVLDLRAFDGQLDTMLEKVAKLGNQFCEAWPKLESVIVKNARWERSSSRKKVARDAEAWDVETELV
ncbi:hypothetical protein JCM10295v2_005619 [Rhodotorula toruloides]